MSIIDKIAKKRAELALFVNESARAVLAEDMSEQMRGAVALDLLRLMIASGLSAAAGPLLDVSPAQPKAITKYVLKPAPSDEAIAAALASADDNILGAAKKLGCGNVPIIGYLKRCATATAPVSAQIERQDNVAPAKRQYTVGRERGTVTDAMLLDAVQRHGPNSKAVAAELGLSHGYVNAQRRRLGVPSPKGWATAIGNAKRAADPRALPKVVWTDAKRFELAEMAMRSPRPTTAEIAQAFRTTESAVWIALSRFGITKGIVGVAPGELKDLSGFKRIACLSCERPFVSEGKHNRRCSKCKGNDHMVAA